MLAKKNLDELNQSSREFYERSLIKMNLSLVFAAFAFFFLGFCCMAATRSAIMQYDAVNALHPGVRAPSVDDDGNTQMGGGFGFAAFCYILGFIISSAVSIYLSPFFCGTKNESKILSTPQNIDGSDSPSAPAANSSVPVAQPVPDLYAGYPEPQSALNKI